MKFLKCGPGYSKELDFKTLKEVENFINDALQEKFQKEKKLDDVLVIPQKVTINCEVGEFLTCDIKLAFNIFVGHEYPQAVNVEDCEVGR